MADNVLVDVWSGDNHQEHIARFLCPMDEALQIARNELASGYLVNLRVEIRWGPEIQFDDRSKH